jgi:hypothetical protein
MEDKFGTIRAAGGQPDAADSDLYQLVMPLAFSSRSWSRFGFLPSHKRLKKSEGRTSQRDEPDAEPLSLCRYRMARANAITSAIRINISLAFKSPLRSYEKHSSTNREGEKQTQLYTSRATLNGKNGPAAEAPRQPSQSSGRSQVARLGLSRPIMVCLALASIGKHGRAAKARRA